MSASPSSQDDRLSWGTDAPELDHARYAPENRTDNTAPEVAPGRDAQVSYDSSPPKAYPTSTMEPNVDSTTIAEISEPKPSKTTLVLVAVIAVLVAASLGIAFGVGLTTRKASQPSSNTSTPPTTVSNVSRSSTPHALMDNTPLSAIILPNDNRQLYFRDQTGAIRRAEYFPQAQIWRTSDTRLPANARNNTPIAVIPGFEIFAFGSDPQDAYKFIKSSQNDVILFYINSTDHLDCVKQHIGPAPCQLPYWPYTSLPADTSHVSASLLEFENTELGLLLAYQDSSQTLVMLLGFANQTSSKWTWQQETAKTISDLNEVLNKQGFGDEMVENTAACRVLPESLLCRNTESYTEYKFELTSISEVGLSRGDIFDTSMYDSDFADIAPLAGGGFLSINDTILEAFTYDNPPFPVAKIPYNHIAGIYATNSSNSYVYYQINDTTFIEYLLDSTSSVWVPKNITVDTA